MKIKTFIFLAVVSVFSFQASGQTPLDALLTIRTGVLQQSGSASNITLTGTTTLGKSGTLATYQIYQDPINGNLVIAVPQGALSIYTDGSGYPVMVWNGSIQANDFAGNINASGAIDASNIATGTVNTSRLPWPVGMFVNSPGSNSGIPNVPVNVPYFYEWINPGDSSGGSQIINYRTASQIKTDMSMLTASASITWPALSATSTSTQTITVTGADPAVTPSVHLGWSAALATGLECAQAWVSATNVVSISLRNNTGSTITPGAVTVRATVHMP